MNRFKNIFTPILNFTGVIYATERIVRSNENIAKMQIASNERIAVFRQNTPTDDNLKSSIIPFDLNDFNEFMNKFNDFIDSFTLIQFMSLSFILLASIALYCSIWILIYSDPFNLNISDKIKKILPNIFSPIVDLNLKLNRIVFNFYVFMVFLCLITIIFYGYRFYNLDL